MPRGRARSAPSESARAPSSACTGATPPRGCARRPRDWPPGSFGCDAVDVGGGDAGGFGGERLERVARHGGRSGREVAKRREERLHGHGGERIGMLAMVELDAAAVDHDAQVVNEKRARAVLIVMGLELLPDEIFELSLFGLSQQ